MRDLHTARVEMEVNVFEEISTSIAKKVDHLPPPIFKSQAMMTRHRM